MPASNSDGRERRNDLASTGTAVHAVYCLTSPSSPSSPFPRLMNLLLWVQRGMGKYYVGRPPCPCNSDLSMRFLLWSSRLPASSLVLRVSVLRNSLPQVSEVCLLRSFPAGSKQPLLFCPEPFLWSVDGDRRKGRE